MAGASDRRKASGGGDGGGANWMDTYGDLVTLLLCFFVLLFAFSNVDAAKWEALVGSFTGVSVMSLTPMSPEVAMERPVSSFGPRGIVDEDEGDGDENDPEGSAAPVPGTISVSIQRMYDVYEAMTKYAREHNIDAQIVLIEDEYSVKMVFNDMVFFNTAEARLLPESIPILDEVIELFRDLEEREMYEVLRVEGHTDKRPINTVQYPSNWELSADRALRVISYFRQTGLLNPAKLVCVGYGEERPLVDEDTLEAYALNRRVEFHVETLPQVRIPIDSRAGN